MEQLCQSVDLKDLPNEIWKPIEGYEDLYEISNYGRVKSLAKYVNSPRGGLAYRKERILKPLTFNGIKSIFVSINNISSAINICREVYKLFSNDALLDYSDYFIIPKNQNLFNSHISNLTKIHKDIFYQSMNKGKEKKSTFKEFIGIRYNTYKRITDKKMKTKRICSFICHNHTYKYLGTYDKPEEAARAYDIYIIKNGLNRKTNFDRSEYSNII